MKKFILFILAFVCIISLTACKNNDAEENINNFPIGTNDSSDAEKIGGGVQIPNPFEDFKTLEEAEEKSGIEISAPETIENYEISAYRAMENRLIEIIYGTQDEKIVLRKAEGDEDISGVYLNEDEGAWEKKEIVDIEVKCFIKNGKVYNAIWSDDAYSYALTAQMGISSDSITEYVEEISEK